MTELAKSQEPSMEEILASIRRIISDDDVTKPTSLSPDGFKSNVQAVRPAPPPAPPPAPHIVPSEPNSSEMTSLKSTAAADAGSEQAARVEEPSAEILDLTESMAASSPPSPALHADPNAAPQFRTIDGSSDVSFDDTLERPAMQSSFDEPRRSFGHNGSEHRPPQRGPLVSNDTSAAVDSAFNSLAQTVLVQNARTLEDLVREMLRPMLKGWLDDNLPGLVERLVRAEIERVSRGR